jgi:hypothetical protein
MKKSIALITILVLAAILVSGCAQPKPFKYHPGTEIPEGPGLFSKEKGEFTLYDSNKQAAAPQAQATGTAADPPADSEAFRQFQDWKKEQKDFQAFQEWKRSSQGSREYEEFQEWKRWKTYMLWIEEQKPTK